jgi:hypothetical protein
VVIVDPLAQSNGHLIIIIVMIIMIIIITPSSKPVCCAPNRQGSASVVIVDPLAQSNGHLSAPPPRSPKAVSPGKLGRSQTAPLSGDRVGGARIGLVTTMPWMMLMMTMMMMMTPMTKLTKPSVAAVSAAAAPPIQRGQRVAVAPQQAVPPPAFIGRRGRGRGRGRGRRRGRPRREDPPPGTQVKQHPGAQPPSWCTTPPTHGRLNPLSTTLSLCSSPSASFPTLAGPGVGVGMGAGVGLGSPQNSFKKFGNNPALAASLGRSGNGGLTLNAISEADNSRANSFVSDNSRANSFVVPPTATATGGAIPPLERSLTSGGGTVLAPLGGAAPRVPAERRAGDQPVSPATKMVNSVKLCERVYSCDLCQSVWPSACRLDEGCPDVSSLREVPEGGGGPDRVPCAWRAGWGRGWRGGRGWDGGGRVVTAPRRLGAHGGPQAEHVWEAQG